MDSIEISRSTTRRDNGEPTDRTKAQLLKKQKLKAAEKILAEKRKRKESQSNVIFAQYQRIYSKFGLMISIPFVCRKPQYITVSISHLVRPNAIFLHPRIKVGKSHLIKPKTTMRKLKESFAVFSYVFLLKGRGPCKFKLKLPTRAELVRLYPTLDDFMTASLEWPGLEISSTDLEGYPECVLLESIPDKYEIEIRIKTGDEYIKPTKESKKLKQKVALLLLDEEEESSVSSCDSDSLED